jgi:tripartite-type tricarboxylate transporter receptor subunit TctC
MPSFDRRSFLLVGAGAMFAAPAVRAQTFPNRPITLVVPFTPGGTTDILARLLGQRLGESFGRNVIVENRPGAGGSVAAEQVARAQPDGHTLLMGHIGTLAVNPSLYPRLGYDPRRDFAPVSMVSTVHNVLAVHPSVPVEDVRGLIAHAKARPGALNFASGGNGSAAHIAMALFNDMAGLDMVHIPYRGTGPAVNDLRGGRVQLMMTGAPVLLPLVASNDLRGLGVSGERRLASAPNLPTVAEAALPGFEASQWYGIVAPAGTPEPIVMALNTEIRRGMTSGDTAERLAREGADVWVDSPAEFATHICREIERWGGLVRRAGLRPD